MCEEYESYHRPVVEEQFDPSFVPSVMKPNMPLNDDPAQEEYVLQKSQIENLPRQDRTIKICADSGFLTTVAELDNIS